MTNNHLLATIGQYALILNPKKEILLLQRVRSKLWSLPGGRLNQGEDWEKAFIREVKEETSLETTGFSPVAVALVKDPYQTKYCVFFEVCVRSLIDLKVNNQEHINYRWFAISDLHGMIIDSYPQFTPTITEYLKSK
ncbi:MAG TPA: NUDIX hydrolase [Candidatus Bathyarchaeia archaeon]|nr:NUDIX hydrolase [Candidatus Bathyarchaeia archaeon]